MSRRLPDGSKVRVDGGDVCAVYVDAFATRGMTSPFAKAALEQFHQKREDHFDNSKLEVQHIVVHATNPTRSLGDVPDAVVCNDVVCTVLNVNDYWD